MSTTPKSDAAYALNEPVQLYEQCREMEMALESAHGELTAWAADALNCRQAIRALLKFHPESSEDGAELPREYWNEDYRHAVDLAKKCLEAGK